MAALLPVTLATDRTVLIEAALQTLRRTITQSTAERDDLLASYHAQKESMSAETQTDFTRAQAAYDTTIDSLTCLCRYIEQAPAQPAAQTTEQVTDYSLFDIHETRLVQPTVDSSLERTHIDETVLLLPHHCAQTAFRFVVRDTYQLCITNRTHWAFHKKGSGSFDIGKPGLKTDERGAGERWESTGGSGHITHIY